MKSDKTGASSNWRRPGVLNTELEPDEVQQHVKLSPAQIAHEEREKAALVEAMRLPVEKSAVAPEAQDRRRVDVIIKPVQKPVVDVAAAEQAVTDALAEQARLLQVVDAAKADLEAANVKVTQAREAAVAASHEHGKA